MTCWLDIRCWRMRISRLTLQSLSPTPATITPTTWPGSGQWIYQGTPRWMTGCLNVSSMFSWHLSTNIIHTNSLPGTLVAHKSHNGSVGRGGRATDGQVRMDCQLLWPQIKGMGRAGSRQSAEGQPRTNMLCHPPAGHLCKTSGAVSGKVDKVPRVTTYGNVE